MAVKTKKEGYMRRILVTGLKDPAGGVESVVMGYIQRFDHAAVRVDVAVFSTHFSLKEKIEAYGGKVWCLPSRISSPVAYKKAVRDIFRREDYDAVWCHFSGLTNIDFLKQAKLAEVPIRIAHAHTADFAWGSPLMRYAVPILHRKNQRILSRFSTHYWSCSDAASAFMFGSQCLKKISLIPNAIDVNAFKSDEKVRRETRKEYGLSDKIVVVHVGRMCAAKNQRFVLDIFKALLEKQTNARLLFVGDGELREEIYAHAKAIGVHQKVVFVGASDGVTEFLQAGDVFLLPSVTEGFPVTVLEAQAAGLPCVVSAQAVPPSTNVSDNVTFLSLGETPAMWADAVLAVVGERDCQACEKIKKAGFDVTTCATRLQAFFCSKKVGIVTFPRAINYGTVLQALALQEAVAARGAFAYFADHFCEKIVNADKLLDGTRILDWKYVAAHLLNYPTARTRIKRFAAFATLHMRFGSEIPQDADIMIAGSDQIWNMDITGNDTYYFLDFPKRDTKKASYAASFGVESLKSEQLSSLKGLLNDFDCISVREKQAAELIKTVIGKDVPVVLDPTFLLCREEWESYMAPAKEDEYIFVYTVFNSKTVWEFAEALSTKTGLPIKTVSYSRLHKHTAAYDYTAGPSEWLRYMADAAYVVTNSFHGVAFSVNFKKQFFYELPPAASGVASRVSHITERYALTAREISVCDMAAKIEFDTVEKQLAEDIKASQTVLNAVLDL